MRDYVINAGWNEAGSYIHTRSIIERDTTFQESGRRVGVRVLFPVLLPLLFPIVPTSERRRLAGHHSGLYEVSRTPGYTWIHVGTESGVANGCMRISDYRNPCVLGV